jgi:hypothetical protein
MNTDVGVTLVPLATQLVSSTSRTCLRSKIP